MKLVVTITHMDGVLYVTATGGRGTAQEILYHTQNAFNAAKRHQCNRVPQVQKLLEVWNQAPRTLIADDMNAHPEDSDIALFLQSGLISAQDATNRGDLLTFSSAEPVERID